MVELAYYSKPLNYTDPAVKHSMSLNHTQIE